MFRVLQEHRQRLSVSIVLSLLICSVCHAGKIPVVERIETGKVVSVTDGDTVRVLIGQEQIRIRLEGIDAPEQKQAFGQRSKERLLELVAGKTVQLHVTGQDRYGRTLGKLMINGVDINELMILEGLAWHYERYNSEQHYAEAQLIARRAKSGLWSENDPVPPWEFRKRK